MLSDNILIETIHYAEIRIALDYDDNKPRSDVFDPAAEELKSEVERIIREAQIFDNGQPNVAENDEFRCHLLTEVGLMGYSLDAVTKVALEIAEFANNHPNLKILPR